jgi:diacylglycerol kinase (ATP)
VTASPAELAVVCAGFVRALERQRHEGGAPAGGTWAPVVLVGGDGSHMAGVSALGDSGGLVAASVALASGGTVGTTARLWGSSGDAVTDVARALEPRRVVRRATLRVEDSEGRRHTGFIWGTGLVARFFVRYDAAGGGVLPAASLMVRLVGGAALGSSLAREVLAPMPMRVRVDGRPVEGDAFSLAVSAVHPTVGLGVRVTYRAGQDPARVHLVASTATLGELARAFPRTLLGAPLGGHTYDALAARAEIQFLEEPGDAYVMDGDTFLARSLTLGPGPALDVVDLGDQRR